MRLRTAFARWTCCGCGACEIRRCGRRCWSAALATCLSLLLPFDAFTLVVLCSTSLSFTLSHSLKSLHTLDSSSLFVEGASSPSSSLSGDQLSAARRTKRNGEVSQIKVRRSSSSTDRQTFARSHAANQTHVQVDSIDYPTEGNCCIGCAATRRHPPRADDRPPAHAAHSRSLLIGRPRPRRDGRMRVVHQCASTRGMTHMQ